MGCGCLKANERTVQPFENRIEIDKTSFIQTETTMPDTIPNFDTDVLQRSYTIPVLVDFWAPWCAPCRALGPVLERLARKNPERFALVKINTEELPDVSARYGIRSIPNVKLFVDGEVVDEFTGALPEAMIEEWLNRILPSPLRDKIRQAETDMLAGHADKAAALLEEVLAAEPDNAVAAVMLARLLLSSDHQRAAATVERIGPDSDVYPMAESIRTFSRLFGYAENPGTLPDAPVKSAYLSAIEYLKNADFERALSGFIEVIRSARHYDDDGARKACLAVFAFLGDDHELTREYRGRLASALYV
jgi:putative thioredoxin